MKLPRWASRSDSPPGFDPSTVVDSYGTDGYEDGGNDVTTRNRQL